jgi:hypothetical protein
MALVVRPPRSTTIIWARFLLDTPFRNGKAMCVPFLLLWSNLKLQAANPINITTD